ncbi:hypothetical protein BHE74_00018695 [Ensete ventricosum]|uniref:Aminotransferase class I/classII large domain-containing protein n=1 Tax=Ensete ventricosum TaxID=4639 RepID=A0A445M941_ENSVE|nr:hypothetical protein BHE74_00018695 [Ensete ventricosum]RZR70762.1 hypothetical protein BHM03_00001342 [Ensete ventricosum]
MRLIVPLQGVVQGRGGLVLGTLIPCALFYFLQLYLRRNRSPPPTSPQPPAANGADLLGIVRSSSRNFLSARGSSGHAALSSRAALIARSGDSPYFVGTKKCSEDPYHPIDNPDGVIQLGLAENRLSLDLIGDWLARNVKDTLLDERQGGLSITGLATYQPFDGLVELKMLSGLLELVLYYAIMCDLGIPLMFVEHDYVDFSLFYWLTISNYAGNAFLVPSPYYPGYDRNIRWRAGLELIPVPCRSTDKFGLSIPALERAYNQAKMRGVKVRAVLFSNPSNPVGNLLHRETLRDLLDFVTEKGIHVIADEVFAGSIHGTEDFVSMAEVLNTDEFDRSRVHIVYGLSKDLSIPGFRIGLIYSFNEHVIAAASKLARFSSVSVPTQHLLISMLTDTKFVIRYIKTNRERLRVMYALLVNGLKQLGVESVKSSGGFYCWTDMSKYMKSYSEKGELELWKEMLNVAKIHLTPGTACHCIEPGWFRLCFTTLTEKDVPVVLERIKRLVDNH